MLYDRIKDITHTHTHNTQKDIFSNNHQKKLFLGHQKGNIFFPFCMELSNKGQVVKTFDPEVKYMTLEKG